MSGKRKFPEFVAEINVDINADRAAIDLTDKEGTEWKLFRERNRWRVCRGYFVSPHTIASQSFMYDPEPQNDECEFMGDFFRLLGKILDRSHESFVQAIKEYRAEKDNQSELAEKQRQEHAEAFYAKWTNSASGSATENRTTFIYLMRHRNGLTKIGKSNQPKARERTLQAEDPRLELVFYAKTDHSVEGRLHRIFAPVRVRGEWFDLADHHVDWIKWILSNGKEE